MAQMEQRDSFKSRVGFILSCVGSAVGIGAIWLFPYRVGEFGGAVFLIPFMLFTVLLGLTGVIAELTFGRAMRTGPIGAFKKGLQQRKKEWGKWLGIIPVFGSFGIAMGYAVVVGWFLKYTIQAFTGAAVYNADSTAFFVQIAGDYGSLHWHLIASLALLLIMFGGVQNGIEKLNKILIPVFFAIFLFLVVRVAFLPNALEGYKFLLTPHWDMLLEPKVWIFALGQAFFALSLAGSGTLVYGSYLDEKVDIFYVAKYVVLFDIAAAVLAVLIIIPAVFSFGMEPAAGPPLMFMVMPEIFKQIPLGSVLAGIFFLAILFAGLTSLVNLFETPIEALQNEFRLSRKSAVSIVVSAGFVLGIFLENGETLGLWMDIVSIYIIPLGALIAGVIFFWVCKPEFIRGQLQLGHGKPVGEAYVALGKYLFCGLTALVYLVEIIRNI